MNTIDSLTRFFNSELEVIPLLENLEDREYLLAKATGAFEFVMFTTSDSKKRQAISDLWKEYYSKLREVVYGN